VTTQHNLPLRLSSFVGRERELHEVRAALRHTRLLTLAGTGGCGKTRLAIELAEVLLAAYPGGVHLVELAPLATPTPCRVRSPRPSACNRPRCRPDGGAVPARVRTAATDADRPGQLRATSSMPPRH